MKIEPKKILKDEVQWVDKETRFIGRLAPFLHLKLILRVFVLLIILILIMIYFHKIFLTVLFIFIVSYIRFKRVKYGLYMEIEPSYLLGIALTLGFGLEYGAAYILIPAIVSGITDGFAGALLINMINKFIVFGSVYLFWNIFKNSTYIILFATLMVVITDIIGYKFRRQLGQPIHQILQAIGLNSLLRLAYFMVFLEWITKLL